MENNEQTTAIATLNPVNEKPAYCSIVPKTREEKVKLFNALEQCDVRLSDCKNQDIEIKDVFIQKYEKEENGEIKTKFRTIIFDKDGKTYVTASYGIYNSLAKIMSAFGEPNTWENPLSVKVVERPLGDGRNALGLKLNETK